MKKFINKKVEHFCNNCNTITKMKVTNQTSKYLKICWLKCTECKTISMIKIGELKKKVIINGKLKSSITKYKTDKQITEYNPSNRYRIGQRLFHPVFNDKGVVVKKELETGDYEKITVIFDNIGEKILVQRFRKGSQFHSV